MELTRLNRLIGSLAVMTLMTSACTSTPTTSSETGAAMTQAVETVVSKVVHPLAKPGFMVEEEDGRLWVLRPGQNKSEKHSTLIGAGPRGMTIKALDEATALEYVVARPGFLTRVEDGRIWVLKPGQEMSEKHVTFIGAGPRGMTVKALDEATALAYLAAKPGFSVELDGSRLWVLANGQQKSEKHVTLIGAGPRGTTLKALDIETAQRYLAAKFGYQVMIEDGRIWVLEPGQSKSEKHVTRIGAGPRGMTIKALDESVISGYLRASY